MKNAWEICECGHDKTEHKTNEKLCIYRDREDKMCIGWKIDQKATEEIEAMVADFQSAFEVKQVSGDSWSVSQISDDTTAKEIAERFGVESNALENAK